MSRQYLAKWLRSESVTSAVWSGCSLLWLLGVLFSGPRRREPGHLIMPKLQNRDRHRPQPHRRRSSTSCRGSESSEGKGSTFTPCRSQPGSSVLGGEHASARLVSGPERVRRPPMVGRLSVDRACAAARFGPHVSLVVREVTDGNARQYRLRRSGRHRPCNGCVHRAWRAHTPTSDPGARVACPCGGPDPF